MGAAWRTAASPRRAPWGMATLAVAFVATPAAAQVPGIDGRTFRPSSDPGALVGAEPVTTPAAWEWNVALWSSYGPRPFNVGAGRPVDHAVHGSVVANLGLGRGLALGLELPGALQTGATGQSTSVVGGGRIPPGALGDLAVHGKGTLLDNTNGGFGLALRGLVTAPTGEGGSFLGERGATAAVRVLVDYNLLVAGLQVSAGFKARTDTVRWPAAPRTDGVPWGDEIPWSVSLRLRPAVLRSIVDLDPSGRQTWELSARGTFPASPVAPWGLGDKGSSLLTTALLALADRVELGASREVFLLAGVDVGLAGYAAGAPVIRGIVGLGWAPRTHDVDHDGIPDDVDQCREIPEDLDGFEDQDGCPEIDDDDDGVVDTEDACPRTPGVATGDPHTNGCPP